MATDAKSERKPPRKRASKRALRITAWTAGATSFLMSGALIGMAPRPAAGSGQPQVVVVKRTIKRIVSQPSKPAATSKPRVSIVTSGASKPAAPATTTSGSHAG